MCEDQLGARRNDLMRVPTSAIAIRPLSPIGMDLLEGISMS